MPNDGRALEAVGPDDDDFKEDAEEMDADDYDGPTVEAIMVELAKRYSEIQAGQAEAEAQDQKDWHDRNVVEPTYSPRGLLWTYRNSNTLRQNIEAIAHNVDGFGWTAEPAIDFDAADLETQVYTAMYLDRIAAWEMLDDPSAKKPDPPTGEEVRDSITRWKSESAVEKAMLQQHFMSACVETSFVDLRKRTTMDREIIGWGAWEVIRSHGHRGRPRRYVHVPAHSLRYQRLTNPVRVRERVHTSPFTYQWVDVFRRFHVIVQRDEDRAEMPIRYFREFGDPRIVSSSTGVEFDSVEQMREKEGEKAIPANEILMFQSYFPGSPYGGPRWHGVIPELKGSWLAANHNVDFLENSAIPRGMLLVNDGRIQRKSVRDLKNWFGTAKGVAMNRLAVIQAETSRDRAFDGSGRVRMEFVDLTSAQREDAMFAEYDERVQSKVGQAFRLPPILRGETKDFNRATATAALAYSEEQVFSPDRNAFDWIMNRRILPELGIRFWRFRSRGPTKQDPEVMSKVLEILLKQAVVVPAEVRSIAERMLGVDLLRVAGDFQQLPISLVMQGFKPPKKERVGEETDVESDDEEQEQLSTGDALEKLREMVGEEKFDELVKQHFGTIEKDRAEYESLVPDDGDEDSE